jgi:hypothetical protein
MMQKHLAYHLESIALLALPQSTGFEQDSEQGDADSDKAIQDSRLDDRNDLPALSISGDSEGDSPGSQTKSIDAGSMDPFSDFASISAAIDKAGAVIDLCYRYRDGIKDAPKAIAHLMTEVRAIRTALETLVTILKEGQSSGTAHLSTLIEIMKGNGLLGQCYDELQGLKVALEAIPRDIEWPLTEKDVDKTVLRLQRLSALFQLAFSGYHT